MRGMSLYTLTVYQFWCKSTSDDEPLRRWLCASQLLGTVRAVDMISVDDEALVGQGEAALLAVEAVLMPGVSFIIHHIGAMTKPCIVKDRTGHLSVSSTTTT